VEPHRKAHGAVPSRSIRCVSSNDLFSLTVVEKQKIDSPARRASTKAVGFLGVSYVCYEL
jgi:hypothetical protein